MKAETKMAEQRPPRNVPLYSLVAVGVGILVLVAALTITFVIQDRSDRALEREIVRTTSKLQIVGNEIADIRDAQRNNLNDYISSYAQIEPLLTQYDEKLQECTNLYSQARERKSHRRIVHVIRNNRSYDPATWDNMREILDLTRGVIDIIKREASVIHAMASLPEADRMQFWHEQFLPLEHQEEDLRKRLAIAGQRMYCCLRRAINDIHPVASVAALRPQKLMDGIGEVMLRKERSLSFMFRKLPIVSLPDNVVIQWLEKHGLEGARVLACLVPRPFMSSHGPDLDSVTRFILEKYGDDDIVFSSWVAGMHDGGAYAGSIADYMEHRASMQSQS